MIDYINDATFSGTPRQVFVVVVIVVVVVVDVERR